MASRSAICGAAALALAVTLGMFGCGSSSNQKSAATKLEPPAESIPDLRFAANCIIDTMQDPKQPFHISLSRKDDDVSYAYTSEADFTPDTFEGTTNWKSGEDSRKVSGARTDANAWDASVMLLAGPLTSAAINDLIAAQSIVVAAQPEFVGGYDTLKYVFDTVRLSAADKTRFTGMLKAKDFSVTGAAWVTKDTHCMVKYVTDYHFTTKDDHLGSVHNEGSIVKQ